MSYGKGSGEPWGGGPLTPAADPRCDVGGQPTSYIFSDEPDGPLPGVHWEPYSFAVDAAGDITAAPEAVQDSYFRVQNGFGLWNYSRSPAVPGPGTPYVERGHGIALGGVLAGRNARVSVLFREPSGLVDEAQDEFYLRVGVMLRFSPSIQPSVQFVEGAVLAYWLNGAWVTPLSVRAYRKDAGSPPVMLAGADPTEPRPVDTWRAGPGGRAELEVSVRDAALRVELNGVVAVEAAVPDAGADNRVVVAAQAWNRAGAVLTPIPVMVGVQLQSLRDLGRLGPPPALPGSVNMEAPQLDSVYYLPIREWLEASYLKRIGGRQFEALVDLDADVEGTRIGLRVGDILRAVEPYEAQEFTRVVRDLAAHRGRGGL